MIIVMSEKRPHKAYRIDPKLYDQLMSEIKKTGKKGSAGFNQVLKKVLENKNGNTQSNDC